MSRSNFNRKCKNFNFRILTGIFVVSLLGIVITGRKWCRNVKRLLHGYHVTFKFGDGIFFPIFAFLRRRFHMYSVELQQCFIQIRQVALHIEIQYEIDCIKQFWSKHNRF